MLIQTSCSCLKGCYLCYIKDSITKRKPKLLLKMEFLRNASSEFLTNLGVVEECTKISYVVTSRDVDYPINVNNVCFKI